MAGECIVAKIALLTSDCRIVSSAYSLTQKQAEQLYMPIRQQPLESLKSPTASIGLDELKDN